MIKIDNNKEMEKNEQCNITFEISKDNKEIIRVQKLNQNIYLGSKYNVKRDIDKIVNFVKENIKDNNIIILGLATGEYIDYINDFIEEERSVLIIEPDINIYTKFKEKKKYINDNIKVIYYNIENIELIENHFKDLALENFKLFEYCNYNRIYYKIMNNIKKKIIDFTISSRIDRNTSIFFSRIWFECFIKNIKYLNRSKKINGVRGLYKDKPAIIVSAGPSLTKNISKLHNFEDKALIFTGGRTLKTLMDEGIEPDFLSIIDSQELSYELVSDVIDKSEVTLIHSELLPSKVFNKHNGERLFYSINPSINDIVGYSGFNAIGSSVAHSCLNSALYMGCNPIIFIGQDLAYTNDKVHAENAEFTKEGLKYYEDINNFDNDDFKYIDDIYGNKVKSRDDLILFKKQFEEIIRENPNVTFINSTEGGANIEGTIVKDLLDNTEILNSEIKIDKVNLSGDSKIDIDYIYILKKTEKYCTEALVKLKSAIHHNKYYYDEFINKGKIRESSLKAFDEADEFIKNITQEISFIEYLFADVINEILHNPKYKINKDDTELQKAKRIYDRGQYMYTEIKKQIEYALDIVRDELKEIESSEGF